MVIGAGQRRLDVAERRFTHLNRQAGRLFKLDRAIGDSRPAAQAVAFDLGLGLGKLGDLLLAKAPAQPPRFFSAVVSTAATNGVAAPRSRLPRLTPPR